MKVLCIGDIMGEPGRRAVARAVPRLIAQHRIDAVVANGENLAGGFGITPELAEELFETGISVITTGNHAWDKKEAVDYFSREPRLLRPANYPAGVPGNGSVVIETPPPQNQAHLHQNPPL
jgi:calcineurin-like phosphoesterase